MKKNLIITIGPLLFTVLFFCACQKAAKDLNNETKVTTSAARSGEGGACRLTQYNYYDAIHDYSQIDYFSYKNRLVDEWTTFYGWVYKMEYDGNRKMKIARAYAGGELAYTIQIDF